MPCTGGLQVRLWPDATNPAGSRHHGGGAAMCEDDCNNNGGSQLDSGLRARVHRNGSSTTARSIGGSRFASTSFGQSMASLRSNQPQSTLRYLRITKASNRSRPTIQPTDSTAQILRAPERAFTPSRYHSTPESERARRHRAEPSRSFRSDTRANPGSRAKPEVCDLA